MRLLTTTLMLMCSIVGIVDAADLPKVKTVENVKPTSASEEVVKILAPKSFAIEEGGKEVLHFWVRAEVPSTASPGGLIEYDSLEEGGLIGIYEVKKEGFTDFRNQKLPVGIYTIRTAPHPQDGNHMGIAPTPTFGVLIPVAEDKSPEPMEREKMLEESKKSVNTGHPGAIYLEPFFEKPAGTLPAIRENDLKHIVLDVMTKAKLATESVDLPIAFVFIGKTEAE